MGDKSVQKEKDKKKVLHTTAKPVMVERTEQTQLEGTVHTTHTGLHVGDEGSASGGMPAEMQKKKSSSGKKPKKKSKEPPAPPASVAMVQSLAFAPKKVALGDPPAFTEAQLTKMEEQSTGIRGDDTASPLIADFLDPVYQEEKIFFFELKEKGFDFAGELSDKQLKEYTLKHNGKTVPYTDAMIQIADQSIQHYERILEDPNYQRYLQTVYTHTMKNPEKMNPNLRGFEAMEGKVISDIISKGMFPFMSRLGKDARNAGDMDMAAFAMKLSTLMGYLEPMNRSGEMPPELAPLVGQYAEMRRKMVNVMRGGTYSPQGYKEIPDYQALAKQLQANPSMLNNYDPVTAPLVMQKAIAHNAILRERAKDDDDPSKTLDAWVREFSQLNRRTE